MDEPVWLTRAIVEALHAGQIREHGGRPGLRDPGLLESALARPRHRWGYEPGIDLPSLAAEYGFGLARSHAFLDGKKRVAFVSIDVFLILNGFEIDTAEADVVTTMLGLAAGQIDQEALADWARGVTAPYR